MKTYFADAFTREPFKGNPAGAIQTFLTKYRAKKLGRNKLRAFQSSKRTDMMSTELMEDKVRIFGECVVVRQGAFNIPIA